MMTHGIAGRMMGVANGGDFQSGFVAASVTKGLSKSLPGVWDKVVGDGKVANAMMAATIGGTASKLSGGDFANGAYSAAFSRMFNDDGYGHEETEKDAHLAYAAGKEIKRVNNLSPEMFNELMAPIGYKGGVNKYNVQAAKDYITIELREIVIAGVHAELSPDAALQSLEFGIGAASKTSGGAVLGPISTAFDIKNMRTWTLPRQQDTTYTFHYSCTESSCGITGYSKL